MPAVLKPQMLGTAPAADIAIAVKKDLRATAANAHGKDRFFFAIKDFKTADGKKVALFFVTDKPKDWEATLNRKKVPTLMSGTCAVMKGAEDPKKTQILIKKCLGGTPATIAKLVDVALYKDPTFQAHDIADVDTAKVPGPQNSDKSAPPRKSGEEVARASYEQAKKDNPKFDRNFDDYDPKVVRAQARIALEYSEYKRFRKDVKEFCTAYGIPLDEKDVLKIWWELLDGLAKGNYFDPFVQKAGGWNKFGDEKEGKIIREALLTNAMEALSKFSDHATAYLEKAVATLKDNPSKVWAFWSGTGAKDAAKAEVKDGIVLEGSIGGWFENVWNFTALRGVNNMAVWTSLSNAYASTAAKYRSEFKFRGYVGIGGTREQNVWNMVEKPALMRVLNVEMPAVVNGVDWYVANMKWNFDKNEWERVGPSFSVPNREAVAAKLKEIEDEKKKEEAARAGSTS